MTHTGAAFQGDGFAPEAFQTGTAPDVKAPVTAFQCDAFQVGFQTGCPVVQNQDELIGRKYPRRGRSRPRIYEEEIQVVKEEIREEVLEVQVNEELLKRYEQNLEQIQQQGLALAKSGETAKRIAAQIADLQASIKASELKLSRLRQEEEFLLMVVISL